MEDRYGNLVVIQKIEKSIWLCQCDCGNQTQVKAKYLKNGDTKSCGCLKKRLLSERSVKDLTGLKFNKLTVIQREGSTNDRKVSWLCLCDCGNKTVVAGTKIISGHTKSCGCLNKERITKHNLSKSKTYYAWRSMKERCANPNCRAWKNYGGRGIQVCEEWLNSFEAFLKDMGEAQINQSLDRIDNNKGYCKENCRWATTSEQANNRRSNRLITFKGKTQTVTQWAKETGIKTGTILSRLRRKLPIHEVLNSGK